MSWKELLMRNWRERNNDLNFWRETLKSSFMTSIYLSIRSICNTDSSFKLNFTYLCYDNELSYLGWGNKPILTCSQWLNYITRDQRCQVERHIEGTFGLGLDIDFTEGGKPERTTAIILLTRVPSYLTSNTWLHPRWSFIQLQRRPTGLNLEFSGMVKGNALTASWARGWYTAWVFYRIYIENVSFDELWRAFKMWALNYNCI